MKEMVCKYCGYPWKYKGKMTLYANCPNCRKGNLIKEEEQDQASAPFNAKTGEEKNA